MSDERDGADSAGDDAETAEATPVRGRTAVAARSQQPRGKKSRRDAGDDDTETVTASKTTSKNGSGTTKKTAKRSPDAPSRNPFVYVWTYLQQVVAELRKVIWPNRKQMVSYTTVVLVFLVFMVVLIGLVDLGLTKLVMLVFG